MTEKDFKTKSPIAIFITYFRPHRKLFLLDMGCAFLIALVDLAYPFVSRIAMNQWLPDKKYATFFIVMAIIIVAYFIRSALFYIVAYWGHTFGARVEADIRHDLYKHMQDLGYDFYDNNRTGHLISRLTTDLFDITELAHHGPEDLFISIITIIGALIVLFKIRWELALVVAIIVPLFVVLLFNRKKKMSDASKAAKRKTGHISAEIESGLSGMKTTKAFANESIQLESFDAANNEYKLAKTNFLKEMGIFNATMELFVSLLSVSVITVGGYMIMVGKMDYIDLITFTLYIATFISPVRKLSNFSEMFANGFAGLDRFVELMRTDSSIQDASDARPLENVQGNIVFDHVAFQYGEDVEVLHDVNLNIKRGETVAIVGPSGGGKTTLCQLLPRFYDVDSGYVAIDGTDVRKYEQKSLRNSIGIVQQDVFLFADTIRENIRFGRPDASDDEVIEAAKQAELYEDIMAMPDGFDTYVGERGTLLSGGQKQRVAIARIFLKNPPILILDEATSALDSVTEAKVQHAFDKLAEGRTTLIIAHRLSTIRNADRIVVIAEGKVCERGTHEELVKTGGIYSKLYATQNLVM